jgi:hypothetical protein
MKYLLDTDWIINLLAGRKDTVEYIERFNPEDIGISLITVAEIYESAFNYANPDVGCLKVAIEAQCSCPEFGPHAHRTISSRHFAHL